MQDERKQVWRQCCSAEVTAEVRHCIEHSYALIPAIPSSCSLQLQTNFKQTRSATRRVKSKWRGPFPRNKLASTRPPSTQSEDP